MCLLYRELRPKELAIKPSVIYERLAAYYTKKLKNQKPFFPPALQLVYKHKAEVPIYTPTQTLNREQCCKIGTFHNDILW